MRERSTRRAALGARWPLALLIASIGLTAVAVYEAIRVGASNDVAAEHVVHDYAQFAAWAYANHLEAALRDIGREVLGAVNHGDAMHMSPEVPGPAGLVHYLPFDSRCNCHRPMLGPSPETLIAFSMHADTLAFAVNTHPRPMEGWEIDRPLAIPVPAAALTAYDPDDRRTLLRTVKRLVHEAPDREHGYTYLPLDLHMGRRMLVVALMPTSWGDTIVYGAQYTIDAFATVLREIKEGNDLLPPSIGAGEMRRDFIDISVRDADGGTYFASGKSVRADLAVRQQMTPRFANLQIEAAISPARAGALVVGGLPRSRLPFLLGALLLAAMLTVAAIALLRRESELGRVRAEWIASVSHELRTPLAQIRLFLDTVRLGRATTEERKAWALAQVDRETTRLNHMIEKVLSFSRLGHGSGPDAQPTDVAREAQRIVDEFRPIADTRQVSLITDIAAVPFVPLRSDALRHMLLNLLDNAVKYGPAGQTVTVRVDRMGHAVSVSVSDQGPGVPATESESVWRPFARGRESRNQGGSGIGLSIVRDLAVQHGGRAWVTAAPSGGALFTVALPFAEPSA